MKNIFVTDMEVIVVDEKMEQGNVVLDYSTLQKYEKGKLIPFYHIDTHLHPIGHVEIGGFLEKTPTSKRWVLCELDGELVAIRNVDAVWEDFGRNKLKFTEIVTRFKMVDGFPVEIE
jgi:hypothetical protein